MDHSHAVSSLKCCAYNIKPTHADTAASIEAVLSVHFLTGASQQLIRIILQILPVLLLDSLPDTHQSNTHVELPLPGTHQTNTHVELPLPDTHQTNTHVELPLPGTHQTNTHV